MAFYSQYHIDAFTDRLFAGNPAAVLITEKPLQTNVMQAIAAENNLSETAFLHPHENGEHHYYIRWFTPRCEIDFCGHASLAAAHALMMHKEPPQSLRPLNDQDYKFYGRIGTLLLSAKRDPKSGLPYYTLTVPIQERSTVKAKQDIIQALGVKPVDSFMAGSNLCFILEEPQKVHSFKPDLSSIARLPTQGLCISAAGGEADQNGQNADFTSRYFAPAIGINEDPVTGSVHAAIGPYWADRLGKSKLKAYQASKRGGWIDIKLMPKNGKVSLSGHAITYSRAQLYLPD